MDNTKSYSVRECKPCQPCSQYINIKQVETTKRKKLQYNYHRVPTPVRLTVHKGTIA